MKLLSLILCCASIVLHAELTHVHVPARGQTVIDFPGVSAAYTLDPDCADARVRGQLVVVIGIRPCSTHLIVLTGKEAHDSAITVLPSQQQIDRMRLARLSSLGIRESGSVSAFFSSDRDEVETAVDLARTMRDHTTTISLALANGHDFSVQDRRTVLPRASFQFASPSATVTLLDGSVPEALITVGDARIRGLRLESKN